jgi:protein-S-isoprenylcysteine O-methyltransferase Ste14
MTAAEAARWPAVPPAVEEAPARPLRPLDGALIRDYLGRACVGALFLRLSYNFLADFLQTGRLTGLLFLVSEALVVVLTIVRRPARRVDRSAMAAALTVASVLGPPLLRPTSTAALLPDAFTALVSIAGVLVVIAGKVTIGRSFGLVPANRGIVSGGPYNIVRHPIYAGYLLTHAATLAVYPSVWNVAVILVADTALVFRALAEERVLGADADYQRYCGRVPWHLVPGLF